MIDQTYVPIGVLIGAGGGAAINCDGLNSIGRPLHRYSNPKRAWTRSLPTSTVGKATRRASPDLQYQRLRQALLDDVPLSANRNELYPAGLLAQLSRRSARSAARHRAVTVGGDRQFQRGTLRAQGSVFSGRVRANRHLYSDYDWAPHVDDSAGRQYSLLQLRPTLIPFAQLARVPLHTFKSRRTVRSTGLGRAYTLSTSVSVDNTKSLPAYDYSDFSAAYPLQTAW